MKKDTEREYIISIWTLVFMVIVFAAYICFLELKLGKTQECPEGYTCEKIPEPEKCFITTNRGVLLLGNYTDPEWIGLWTVCESKVFSEGLVCNAGYENGTEIPRCEN